MSEKKRDEKFEHEPRKRRRKPSDSDERYLSEDYYGERYGNDYGYGREGEHVEPRGMDYERSEYAERYEQSDYTELDLIPGPYTGQGPRYHKRSNKRIEKEVRERLAAHTEIDDENIEIEMFNGEVTLRGTVGDRATKRLVETVAESVPGVRDVHNELTLK